MNKLKQTTLAAGLLATSMVASAQLPNTKIESISREFPFQTYQQWVAVVYKDAQAAEKANVSLAPLFDNYERAVSCRWDDSMDNDLKVKERLDARGIKATWYLNSNDVFYLNGQDFRPTAKTLLENGHSIGSHALTHPYITFQNRNRMFQEIAGLRVEWEAELNILINTHAFSFIDYRNFAEGDLVHADVIKTLERSGIYHSPVYANFADELKSDYIISVIMPPENQTFDDFKKAVEWAVNDPKLKEKYPLISHSMHGWYDTPAVPYGFDELEKRLDYLNQYPYWQCNQNQYAAYRYQYLNSTISTSLHEAETIVYQIERPVADQLNDMVPLTLKIEGVSPDQITIVQLDEQTIEPSEKSTATTMLYNLNHTQKQSVPSLIGRVENTDNHAAIAATDQDGDFPGLKCLLHWEDGQLKLNVENNTKTSLDNLTVTYRLPMAWKEGVVHQHVDQIKAGKQWTDTLSPTRMQDDSAYIQGVNYMVAQLDFTTNNTPSRLYATCSWETPWDASLPSRGFEKIGPIDPNEFNIAKFDETMNSAQLPLSSWTSPSKGELKAVHAEENLALDYKTLGPDYIPTQGDWYKPYSQLYILQSEITSQVEQPVEFISTFDDIKTMYLGNQKVENKIAVLPAGKTVLTFAYHTTNVMKPGMHNAVFLRLVNPENKERLTNITFTKPHGDEVKDSYPQVTPGAYIP